MLIWYISIPFPVFLKTLKFTHTSSFPQANSFSCIQLKQGHIQQHMGFCLEYIQLNTLSWIYVFIQTPLLLHCTDKRLCRRSSLQVPIEIVVIRPYFWDTNIDLTMSREQNTSERPQQKQVNYDPRLSALLLSPHSQSFFSNIYCDALYYMASQIKSLYGRCCYVLFLMHWKWISDLEIFELFFRKILIAPEFIFSYGSYTLLSFISTPLNVLKIDT